MPRPGGGPTRSWEMSSGGSRRLYTTTKTCIKHTSSKKEVHPIRSYPAWPLKCVNKCLLIHSLFLGK